MLNMKAMRLYDKTLKCPITSSGHIVTVKHNSKPTTVTTMWLSPTKNTLMARLEDGTPIHVYSWNQEP